MYYELHKSVEANILPLLALFELTFILARALSRGVKSSSSSELLSSEDDSSSSLLSSSLLSSDSSAAASLPFADAAVDGFASVK